MKARPQVTCAALSFVVWTTLLVDANQDVGWSASVGRVLILRTRRDRRDHIHQRGKEDVVVTFCQRLTDFQLAALKDRDVHEPVDWVGDLVETHPVLRQRASKCLSAIRVLVES